MSTLLQFKMLVLMARQPYGSLQSIRKVRHPEIDPPADLIPGYVPNRFELISGFQLSGTFSWSIASDAGEVSLPGRLGEKFYFGNLKSPDGNNILGVYYQGKDDLLVITKSDFPKGSLDLWRTTYEASLIKPCECEGFALRLDGVSLPVRRAELREE